jgi:hypothetical protein
VISELKTIKRVKSIKKTQNELKVSKSQREERVLESHSCYRNFGVQPFSRTKFGQWQLLAAAAMASLHTIFRILEPVTRLEFVSFREIPLLSLLLCLHGRVHGNFRAELASV